MNQERIFVRISKSISDEKINWSISTWCRRQNLVEEYDGQDFDVNFIEKIGWNQVEIRKYFDQMSRWKSSRISVDI